MSAMVIRFYFEMDTAIGVVFNFCFGDSCRGSGGTPINIHNPTALIILKRKPIHKLALVSLIILYGVWSFLWPMDYLKHRYGEGGLTWGILVFWVMIPYVVYFLAGAFLKKPPNKE